MKAVVFVLPDTLAQVILLIGALVATGGFIYSTYLNRRHKKVLADFEKATANFRKMFRDDPDETEETKGEGEKRV